MNTTSSLRTEPLATTRLGVVSVPVADQERARRFYVDVLGFTVVADAPFDGLRWLQLAPRGGGATISLVTWFAGMPAGTLDGLVLTTDDVHADVAALRERGLELADPVEESFGTHTAFADPDGNGWLLLQEPAATAV
jgi:catechol 2,3-dioxygenase-like lactoylglutathione lyase family enzyme